MRLITKAIVLMTLLSAESLAATINSHPTKGARWMAVPRTLQDAKHEIIDDREIRRRTDLFTRQTGCSPTEVACGGNACCPSGFSCYNTGSVAGCCPIGETCSGPPMGCADPNSFECPASIGGCCPNGQECSLDSQGGPRCGDATPGTTSAAVPIYSSTLSTAVPIYESTSAPPAPSAAPIYSSHSAGGNPTSRPAGTESTAGTGSGSIAGTGPRTTATGNGVEKGMGVGVGMAVLLMPAVFVVLA